ncbi:EamA family transporter [uncultured Clostridium sp.]|uniref:DMT family transporter n=1 Tax=uncultured Clostridium sp. TaxID=59620 RepID=UPI0028F0447A|nr:EamA family transporter [uncultured Clostridium sp.]
MTTVICLILYLVFSVSGLILMKTGSSDTSISLIQDKIIFDLKFQILIGAICYFISFALWIYILKSFNLNYIFPIVTGLGYILIMISSFFILKENITTQQIIGAVIILAGIILMNLKSIT